MNGRKILPHPIFQILGHILSLDKRFKLFRKRALDVIRSADYLVDMGPEGGDGGGTVVATGTPEEVAASEVSHTGQFLLELIGEPAAARG